MATSNDEWVQFPARPGPSAPKVQNDKPKAARSTPPVTPSTDDGWIKFPPLPPPKPASTAKTDEFAPVQSTDLPNQVVTPATAPAPAASDPPQIATPKPAASALPASTEFVFKAFKFEGNKVYSSKRLEQLLKKAIPNVQDLADLQKAADTVAQLYQNNGVLARVDLLPQDLTEGEVLITITEGKFAGANLETPNSTKLPTD